MGSSRGPRAERALLRVESLEDRTVLSAYNPGLPLGPQAAAGLVAPDRVTLILNGTTSAAIAATPYASQVRSLGFDDYSVKLVPGTDLDAAVAYYKALPGVSLAEADVILHAAGLVSTERLPNDPSFGSQFGPSKIGAPTVWTQTTGNSTFVVGVIDTGVDYTHQDLYQNIYINQKEIPAGVRTALTDVDGDGLITFRDLNNPINIGPGMITDLNGNGYIDGGDLLRPTAAGGWEDGVDADGNGFVDDIVGWDFANDDNDPMDDVDHGTHVSGTIGATGDNGVGVTGINWSVQIMGIKFLSPAGGTTSDAIAAINYSVLMGVKVTNNSWGGGFDDPTLSQAIARTQGAGQIFVAAAGNNIADNDVTDEFPGNYSRVYSNVITVAASDSGDRLAAFSEYGVKTVTLAAPGVDVLSTTPNDTYSSFNGTSMATPHVTGALALYWGANPGLNAAQVIAKLKSSVDKIPNLNGLVTTGGRLNVANMFGLHPVDPIVVGAPAGSEVVRVLAPGGSTALALDPHPGFLGGIVAAVGDLTNDGVPDVVTAATLGGHVKVFDGATGAELRSFLAFPGYQGPISLAIGDLTGDGVGDIIVAANLNGHVKVFDGVTGALTFSQFVYQGYFGVITVSAADLDGNGQNELVTGANGAAGVHIKAFGAGTMALRESFFATGPSSWTGFSVAVGDLDGDDIPELLVSQGPQVRVLDSQTMAVRADFLAFDPLSNARVTVQAGLFSGDSTAELVAIRETQGQSQVRVFAGPNFSLTDSFVAGSR